MHPVQIKSAQGKIGWGDLRKANTFFEDNVPSVDWDQTRVSGRGTHGIVGNLEVTAFTKRVGGKFQPPSIVTSDNFPLKPAWKYGSITSDASNVVLALNAHQQSSNYVGSIIRDCISLKGSFRSLIFLHVRREVNQAAHYLDKYALKNLDCIWIEETSPCISAVLAFDLLPNIH